MKEDKGQESKENEGEVVFLSYLGDNNNTVSTYVTLLEETENKIVFRTHKNIITIPFSRVLKLKKNLGDSYDRD